VLPELIRIRKHTVIIDALASRNNGKPVIGAALAEVYGKSRVL
jgi:hypothetical protein